jgi:hypothetical protein
MNRMRYFKRMRVFPKFITRVPVEQRGGRLYALGVPVWLAPPCRLSDAVYLKIDEAVHVKAAASGSNMPVGLDPRVWLHRCRCCNAPFIGPSEARLCSNACRAAARRDSVRKASAKRSQRRYEVRNALTSICRHCGKRQTALRSSKRFCSVTCRVAAHRGAPATFRAETPAVAWDRLAAGAAGGRDLGAGVGAHGRSGLRRAQPRGGLARDGSGGVHAPDHASASGASAPNGPSPAARGARTVRSSADSGNRIR